MDTHVGAQAASDGTVRNPEHRVSKAEFSFVQHQGVLALSYRRLYVKASPTIPSVG